MPSAWTDHIKEFAKQHGVNFAEAMKMPECKSSYHSKKINGKGMGVLEKQSIEIPESEVLTKKTKGRPKKEKSEEHIKMVIKEKKPRGRPKKYATAEEAKQVKTKKTIESNKRRKQVLQPQTGMEIEKGEGLAVTPQGCMIYPLTMEQIAKMLKDSPY
jgi:hypothetical protein